MIAKILALLVIATPCILASSDSDWKAIGEMDSGPKRRPSSREDALLIARAHLAAQRNLIEDFLRKYPDDAHRFDAKLRQASILATQGNMDAASGQINEALSILTALDNNPDVPADRKADVGFRRVSLYLQTLRGREAVMREDIVKSARSFVSKYPGDRRGPRLLVEVSTICDGDPELKRQLLQQARALSKEEALNHRIADDLGRLALLDKPLNLKFKTIQGGTFDTAAHKGDVIIVLFWSAESPHCLLWLTNFRKNISLLPNTSVQVATISLDSRRDVVAKRMTEFGMDSWPTNYEGSGWENSIARSLGINALPTVFLIDKSGILRALNAQDDYTARVRMLLSQKF